MKKRILYIVLGMMLLSKAGMGQSFAISSGYYDVNASPVNYNCGRVIFNFNTGNSSTTSVDFEVFSIDPLNNVNSLGTVNLPNNTSSTQTYPAPTYLGIVKFYAEFRDASNGNLLFRSIEYTVEIRANPTITTSGSLSALCYSTNLQSATLSYSATTYTPTSYTVDWNPAANTAGLSDQASTATSFLGSGGNLATINIASSIISGTYNGSLIISNSNGCSNSKAISILIKPLPIVTFIVAAALNECQNSEVTYTTQAGKTNYQWSTTAILNTDYIITNGGLGLTNNTVSLKWLTTGSKTMEINYTDANFCTAETNKNTTTTVNALPTAPTVTSPIICEGQTATITTPSGVYTYTWTVPTGVTAPGNVNTFSTTKAGTYSVTITNSNSCTSDIGVGTVVVNTLPTAPTVTSQTICEGQSTSISMSAPTGVYTYTWTVPTGVATSTTKTVSTSKAGTYSLTITDANSCISEVGTGIVTVNPLPAKPTLTSPKICEGETASVTMLTPTGTSTYTYIWTVPTGVATSTTKTVSTSKAGTYSLTITDANSCISEVGTGIVTVNPLPAKPTLTSPKICEGETASVTMLTPTGTITYTYNWTVPTGVATSTTKSVSTSKAGTYSLTIMDANSCTSEVGTGTVVVNALPPKPTLTSSVICEGETATVTMSTPTGTITYTYTWQVPTGVATSTTNTVSTNKAGNYSLNIMDANSCTSEVGTATVVVNALPAKPTVTSPTICEGQTATITSPSGVYTYTWQVPDGVLAPGNVNTFTTTKAGTYSLSIINNKGCNSAVGSGVVSVNAIPAAPSISSNSPVEEEQTLNLTASNIAGAIYAWSGPNGFVSIRQNPSITGATPANSGTYYATVSLNGCTSVSSLPINILVNAKVLTSPVFQIPNAFTPNSDGHNDTFKIIQNGYVTSILSFRIFTKSGKLIFSDKDGAWDGRYDRVMQDADVYIWIADFINKNNVTEHLSGTVLLLK